MSSGSFSRAARESGCWPLTADRAKPAVPFGGTYRLIDFVLSNLVNAGYLRIAVLTQYKSHSLDRHITQTWRMSTILGNYVTPVPAQQRLGPRWYTGSADAILQSLNLIYDDQPEHIVVFGADHVYRMDPRQMVEPAHRVRGRGDGGRHPGAARRGQRFGIIDADADGEIRAFLEKPADPPGLADSPDESLRLDGQLRLHHRGAARGAAHRRRRRELRPRHGRQHHPDAHRRGRGPGVRLRRNDVPGATERDRGYWRDVGTIDAYYDSHMDLVAVHPVFNLYNREWPIYTNPRSSRRRSSCEGGWRRSRSSAPGASSPGPRCGTR